eukprot:gene24509-biopygen10069
MPRGGCLRP